MASPSITQATLTKLYRALAPRVYWHALQLVHDPEEAHDVTHEAFLALLHRSGCPQGAASSLTLLCQIATHKAIDNLRRRSRWSSMPGLSSLDPGEETEAWGQSTLPQQDNTARVDARSHLTLLIRNESSQALTAAVLYYVEEYTLEEVGRILHLSRRTTSKLLQQLSKRARQRAGLEERLPSTRRQRAFSASEGLGHIEGSAPKRIGR